MKLLIVCSTTDFPNFTRRATVEAIANKIPGTELLLFNGFKAQFGQVTGSKKITTYKYHKWLPGTQSEFGLLGSIEKQLRRLGWRKFFKLYDIIFLSDPNQYLLLNYIENNIPVIYLIRDPNVLQNQLSKDREENILKRAELVLATSRNLAEEYIPKYYGWEHPNMVYWPNCVDLSVWDFHGIIDQNKDKDRSVIGIAGNFGEKRTDYELLDVVTTELTHMDFVIAGNINQKENPEFWKRILEKDHVTYKGFIPHKKLPTEVAGWSVGLVTDRMNQYASYMHHNKVYQYLAKGIPVVSLKIHNDYEEMKPFVSTAKSYEDYIEAIRMALKYGKSTTFREDCRTLAEENTASKRAEVFVELLDNFDS